MAIINWVMKGCPAVKPTKVKDVAQLIQSPCIRGRWWQAEIDYQTAPSGFIYNALDFWLERHPILRFGYKHLPFRFWLMEQFRKSDERGWLMEWLYRKNLKRKARRNRTRKGKRIMRRAFSMVGLLSAASGSLILLLSGESLTPDGKEEILTTIKAAFKIFYQNF